MIQYYDKLPEFVYLKEKKFYIKSDYRIFINFEMEMQGKDRKKAIFEALKGFYPAFFYIIQTGLLDEAVDKFIWFYMCGQDESYYKRNTNKKRKKTGEIFNYKYDADLICGSFLLYAHVNLHKYCHWWRFKEIWNCLPSECEFCRIKSYRAYTGKDKDLLELKEHYKLPPTEAEIREQIRRNKIYEALK